MSQCLSMYWSYIAMEVKFIATVEDWIAFQQIILITLMNCKYVTTNILAVFVIFIIVNVNFFNRVKIK